MKRSFTLLMSLFLVIGSMWAQVTSLEGFSQDKCYTFATSSRGAWAVDAEGTLFSSTGDQGLAEDATDTRQQFAVLSVNGADYYLYSVSAKKFIKADRTLVAGPADALAIADASSQGAGRVQFRFRDVNNSYINLGGSNQMSVDWWGTIDAGNAVLVSEAGDFNAAEALAMLTNVCTVTYEFTYEGEVKYTQELVVAKGDAYPAVQPPFGTVAETPSGTVEEDVTVEVALTVAQLPFVPAADVENIEAWYYVQMHSNNKKYIQYLADQTYIEWADAEVAEAEKDSYTWAFVGNVFDGFKVVNKAATIEKALQSTGGGDATMVAYAEGTQFVLAATSETSEGAQGGFCLRYPENNQYLNAQNGKIAHWGSTDAGSTFTVTLVENEPELPVVDPNDYTSYIVSADLATGEGWNTDGVKSVSGGMAKVSSGATFDFSQTISLPAGQYKMTAQAAFRFGADEETEYAAIQAGTDTHLAKFYAETATYKYEADVQNRWEGASETDYAGEGVSTVNGKFVPNSSSAVQAWFNNGQYVNELVFNVQEDGDVKIGIKNVANNPGGEYTNIGVWTLTRLGDAEADPKQEPEYTEEDYDLTEGTWSDATSYIVNANLAAKDGWTASGLENDSKFDPSLRAAEFYAGWGSLERPNGHLLQEVTLPAGIYRLTGKAFFRQGNGPQDNPEKSLGYLVAGDNKVLVKTLGSANGTANNFGDGANALYADETFNSVLEFELGEETTLNIGYEVTFDEAKSWFIVGAVTLEKKITLKDNFMEQAMAYSMFGQSCQALYSLGAVQEKFYETQAVVESLYGAISAGTPVLKKDVVAAMELMENTLAEIKPIVEYFDGTFSDTKWAMYDIQDNSTANSDEVRTAFDEAVQAALNVSTVTTLAELEAKVAEMEAARREYVKNATPNAEFDMTFLITNPSFETGDMTGWTLGYSADTGAKHNSGNYATGNTHGNYLFNTWWQGVYLSQEIGEVPNGVYTLTVALAGGDDGNDATVYVVANNEKVGTNLVAREAFKDVTVEFMVVDGKIHIGTVGGNDDDTAENPLGSYNENGHWWYKSDNYRLVFKEQLPLEVLLPLKKEAFLARAEKFRTFVDESVDYSWQMINATYLYPVQDEVLGAPEYQIVGLVDKMDEVNDVETLDYWMAEMDKVEALLTKVNAAAVDYYMYRGFKADLETATMVDETVCREAYGVYEQYGNYGGNAMSVEDIEAAALALKAAYIQFVANAVPAEGTMFDMSFVIVNPNFDNNVEGWTTVKAGWNSGEGFGGVSGIAEIADWGATSWDASMSQTLTGLPNGTYVVKAVWMAAPGIEMTFAANEGETTVVGIGDNGGNVDTDGNVVEMGQGFRGWQYVEAEGSVEDGELTIAVSSSSTTQFTWSNADAFKLYYAGAVEEEEPGDDPTGIESVESQNEAVIYDLSGRRVQTMTKGLYIVNGRKVVVK